MDWSDPVARLRLVESVGSEEYNRQIRAHQAASVVATVNGYTIRPVTGGRWGRLFHVDGAGVAFRTQAEAEAEAASLEPGPAVAS